MKSLLIKLLSQKNIVRLKKLISQFDDKIFPFFSKNSWLSSVYYCFFSTQFRREHQAVLKGRLQYKDSLNAIEQSSVLLRRNTHRLEKGLIMQPRRDLFAQDYILETVDCFARCITCSSMCNDELKWAQDVLKNYFDVVGSNVIINDAKELFKSLDLKQFENDDHDSLPYQYKERVKSSISSQQLTSLFKQRRSVRWYKQEPVELLLIEQAIEMASQAPSACNRQPFQFYTVTDMDKASEISSIAMGTTGFSDNIPALVVVVGDLSAYPAERDRHVIYIDSGLASMQLMLAFETMGLSSCPINWPDIEVCERKVATILRLPKHLRPIMLISVGYGEPSGRIPFSQKKNAKILMKEVN